MEVVLAVEEVLLQTLLSPVVALPDAELSMAVGTVSRELADSFQALRLVL